MSDRLPNNLSDKIRQLAYYQIVGGICGIGLVINHICNCLDKVFVKTDKSLNVIYNQILKQLPQKQRAKLKEAQRAWLMFVDKEIECQHAIVDIHVTGTIGGYFYCRVKNELWLQRLQVFQTYSYWLSHEKQ